LGIYHSIPVDDGLNGINIGIKIAVINLAAFLTEKVKTFSFLSHPRFMKFVDGEASAQNSRGKRNCLAEPDPRAPNLIPLLGAP
jgi:hypothetical protein